MTYPDRIARKRMKKDAKNQFIRRLAMNCGWLGAVLLSLTAWAKPEFHPGEVWPDSNGDPIQAHGGGILFQSKVYYWYGEDRTPGGHGAVMCYSSTNLYEWKREGIALASGDLPRANDLPTFVERPKVIYNAHTGKYVMWMHLEQPGYRYSRAGIATSDKPAGPFTFLQAIRPVTNGVAVEGEDPEQQRTLGGTFRDMNLFVDDNGQAYVFYSSEGNWTMYVVQLNPGLHRSENPGGGKQDLGTDPGPADARRAGAV